MEEGGSVHKKWREDVEKKQWWQKMCIGGSGRQT
jgi:hypothetical protein